MEAKKTMACKCVKCGNEADMIIKCEEVVSPVASKASAPQQLKRTVVCTRCGNEAEMIVDYAGA